MSWVITPAYLGAAVSDPDAQAYLRAVETADGQTLEPAVAVAVNSFVIGCKADGIWSAIKASCILAGARTLTGALVPLVGTAPTNINFVSGDYNRKTGLVGDGSTKYLNSNRNNNADPQNSKHMAIYATTRSVIANSYLGMAPASGSSHFGPGGGAEFNFIGARVNSTAGLVTNAQNTAGFMGVDRSSSVGFIARGGGVTSSLTTHTSAIPANGNLLVLDGASATKGDARLAFYSIGESLNLALLDARVTNLINALSAAIP